MPENERESSPLDPSCETPAVRAVVAHIMARVAEASVDDLRARYDLGRVVHHLRYDPSQAGVLTRLAHDLGMHPSALHRYARVTERVCPEEFAQILQLRDAHGQPLTWSHLERIAEVRSAAARRRVAEEAVSGLLSVRAVRHLIRNHPSKSVVGKEQQALARRNGFAIDATNHDKR
ncbi:MAG TPA: hypothetical protein VKU41_25410 [Polyangiaceae bacterium]|nr:hypothetical protein [Polyangiaceae bacterium]